MGSGLCHKHMWKPVRHIWSLKWLLMGFHWRDTSRFGNTRRLIPLVWQGCYCSDAELQELRQLYGVRSGQAFLGHLFKLDFGSLFGCLKTCWKVWCLRRGWHMLWWSPQRNLVIRCRLEEIGVGEVRWWDFTESRSVSNWWGAEETYDVNEHAGRYAKDPEILEQRNKVS